MNNIRELDNYRQILKTKLTEITGNSEHIAKLINYIKLLLEKNQELNLISRQLTIEEIISSHIIDCLVGYKYFLEYESITDIGSGSGMPGIILAILLPDKKFTLIEKSPKKSNFLNEIKLKIDLKNVNIINDLVSEKMIKTHVVTCRAFKDINTILTLSRNFLKNKGIYILYKAKADKIDEELLIAKKQFKFEALIHKIDEIKEKERHIVIIKGL